MEAVMLSPREASGPPSLIGAHLSVAGGLERALYDSVAIGATAVQLFTANQRQWHAKQLTEETVARFRDAQEATGVRSIMSHGSYLVNLGSSDPELLRRSRDLFRLEIERCQQLGVSLLVFHPGAALTASRESCLERVAESLAGMADMFDSDGLTLLVETTAGQGSTVGSSLDEVSFLVKEVSGSVPMGVCVDTCHVFAAGYDLRTPLAWEAFLAQFEREIGLSWLRAFHVNDSKGALGCRTDRHALLGQGCLGMGCFQQLMRMPQLRHIPKYLETPGDLDVWAGEIRLLRDYESASHSPSSAPWPKV